MFYEALPKEHAKYILNLQALAQSKCPIGNCIIKTLQFLNAWNCSCGTEIKHKFLRFIVIKAPLEGGREMAILDLAYPSFRNAFDMNIFCDIFLRNYEPYNTEAWGLAGHWDYVSCIPEWC